MVLSFIINQTIDYTGIIGFLLSICGILVAVKIYSMETRRGIIKHLAQQYTLLYKEEAMLISEIVELRSKTGQATAQSVKREFRDKISSEGVIHEAEKSLEKYL